MKVRAFAALCILTACLGASEAADAAGEPASVIVRRGQSLSAIAAQHGVSVRQLTEWNKLSSPNAVRAGQKLVVGRPAVQSPDGAVRASASAPPRSSAKEAAGVKNTAAVRNPAEVASPEGVPDKVKSDLSGVARTLVQNAARNIRPNAAAKAVTPGADGGFTASYTEVDTSSLRAEVIPSTEKGKYVGSIRYVEHRYECSGKSRAEAMRAACSKVKSRRMNELIRYEKGKWHY